MVIMHEDMTTGQLQDKHDTVQPTSTEFRSVSIVGAGLVGALNACYLARRNIQVDVYEYREDIRHMQHVPGRSINLALSARGRKALAGVGLEKRVIEQHGIPMYGRAIHNSHQGSIRIIPYGKKDQCIYSVGRRFINETLLTEAERFDNVHLHFGHKLIDCELKKAQLNFSSNGAIVRTSADLILGCDGAFSTVRKHMMKMHNFNFSQQYIEHGYMELCIPPTKDGQFAMECNFLHIWPRGEFMMIALPNQDKSWTVTLFMPFSVFAAISDSEKLLNFFNKHYPDAIALIGAEKLTTDFFNSKPLPLVSIKCRPYEAYNRVLIMGDAAHAMVPFYGQGMNAGFEDCSLLNDLMDKHLMKLDMIFTEYTSHRNPDAEAICDLAMYNYVEMRHLVNSRWFLLRKTLDNILYTIIPDVWTPLYTMVSFTTVRYHEAVTRKQWQDKVIHRALSTLVSAVGCGVAMVAIFCYNSYINV